MDSEKLKGVILDQKESMEELLTRERIIKRDTPFDLSNYLNHPNIIAVLGVRRCGKSVFSYTLLREILSTFAYINFDDYRLIEFSTSDFENLLKGFYELYGDFNYILLDEVQNVNGWERFVSSLRVNKTVILTGSNSKLLSGELATSLTGRHVDLVLFPFSFKEFLRYKGKETHDIFSIKSKSSLKRELEEYLTVGGFPETVVMGKRVLSSIINDIISKDIIFRYKVAEVNKFKTFAYSIIKYYSSEISVRRMAKMLNISTATLEKWLNGLRESYLVFMLERFSRSPKPLNSEKKVYVVDTGIINNFTVERSVSKLMENVVAIHLLRKNQLEGVSYLKEQEYEVDFVDSVNRRLVQVSYASGRDEIKEREIKGLLKGSEVTGYNDLILVSWDYEEELVVEGDKRVKVVPLWKFLLLY
ncbi:AAA family ATPase [Sulfolobus sp. A20]|uniref:ATP-binding protein n=2 Tax=Sulfolobaceae TaxID=118883 RepID=UPI000845DA99|nr:ATP-binding protein [Sulfolobus sp. A20]TRM74591.1 ATP-binding protein [Sulfolobus sp. A20-N-F8]TRM84552.1 ATP-binding protein [Sulfolobus sp. F3]TRM87308.1 ATP-binding protein [Sulfolobus sp. E3]TRM88036.1 ATP-binding protein [Sulfolobus sp. C3]TRM98354.1 ATP-binding protein [Sulfolobus sp. F1]TRN04592.1 ATP-binding protein [Sulfolobus sp. E1]